MKKINYKIGLFVLLFLMINTVFSQVKFEKEYRLHSTEVPKKAFNLVDGWNFTKKIKWYAEESNDGKTFEAKTCYQNYKHSIEFDENGKLLDVEKTVKFKKLPGDIQQQIEKNLSKRFKKYRIKKVQIQYSGNPKAVYATIFQMKIGNERLITKYELIVKGKNESHRENFEILFDYKGIIEKELLVKSTDAINLEF